MTDAIKAKADTNVTDKEAAQKKMAYAEFDKKEDAEGIFRESSHLKPEDYAYYHIVRGGASGEPSCDRLDPIK